ncbi:ABC transporter permease [Mucilaginibacter sp.]
MIKNYLKTAWRNLLNNKSYATLNIVGLAVGIAACLLIFLIIKFETSFDNFHSKKYNIYRVLTIQAGPDGKELISGVPFPTAQSLRLDFPQLKGVASILKSNGTLLSLNNDQVNTIKKFKEDDTYYAEPQFFDVFDFSWLAGDKKTALTDPNTVVLTKTEAEKFFGDWKSAIGKTIKLENKTNLKVTGILNDPPENTDFPLKVVISFSTLKDKENNYHDNFANWGSIYGEHYCFVVLPNNQSESQFNNYLTGFVKKHFTTGPIKQDMQLQPLSDIHYNAEVSKYTKGNFSHQLIDAIALIGMFLLVIACVNFINLATAQAVNRSKEVGIRKVLGSTREQLVMQFIIETFIITFTAIVIGIVVAFVALPYFNILLDIKLSTAFLSDPAVILFVIGLLIVVTLLAGFYPAMVLSGFNPIAALKNKITASSTSGVSLRRGLVVLQFCIAQVLIIGMLVIINQMDYFKNKSLGFVKDAVINVGLPNDSISLTKINTLRDELLQQPGVKDVSFSSSSPSDNSNSNTEFTYDNAAKPEPFQANMKYADAEYFNLYHLQLVAGRPYIKTDTIHELVVNETLLKKLGVLNPNTAIGKNILVEGKKALIVGVVKDFNVTSLKKQIPPVIMASYKDTYEDINIKVQPANLTQTLSSIEHTWNATFPDYVYEYKFLDEKIAGFYKSDTQLSQLFKIFSGIAIFISCLGLYGLISFMALQRIKEVGIRKTLGASVGSIVYLFSKEFTVLIFIAFAISAPIGWFVMHRWLMTFTYRYSFGPSIFLISIAASVIIAWLTVGYKALKAALSNPVKSLRSE